MKCSGWKDQKGGGQNNVRPVQMKSPSVDRCLWHWNPQTGLPAGGGALSAQISYVHRIQQLHEDQDHKKKKKGHGLARRGRPPCSSIPGQGNVWMRGIFIPQNPQEMPSASKILLIFGVGGGNVPISVKSVRYPTWGWKSYDPWSAAQRPTTFCQGGGELQSMVMKNESKRKRNNKKNQKERKLRPGRKFFCQCLWHWKGVVPEPHGKRATNRQLRKNENKRKKPQTAGEKQWIT